MNNDNQEADLGRIWKQWVVISSMVEHHKSLGFKRTDRSLM